MLIPMFAALLTGCTNQVTGLIANDASVASDTQSVASTVTESAISATHSLFELRTYTAHPGKLDALHSRFRDHTRTMFEKHGMKNVAYWTPVDTPDTLIYIIAHQNMASAEASWKAFVADPAWQAVYQDSIADGRLVTNIKSQYMRATDYSPTL